MLCNLLILNDDMHCISIIELINESVI